MTVTVIAVDGGNSKTDVSLVAENGAVLALIHGPTVSHQVIGADQGAARLARLVAEARRRAGLESPSDRPRLGLYCLAGADFPSDVRVISRSVASHGLAEQEVVLNDCFGPLRAGAEKGWGIVLICGQGINGAGVAPDGRTLRFAGIGDLSGDWGGGGGLGSAALAAAIRGRDGRSTRTSLERAVAEHFHQRTPEAVMLAMYEQRVDERRRSELAPVVFREAEAGDEVAQEIVNRLAAELVGMGSALIRRLRLTRRDVDVVLAGGVFRATYGPFYQALEAGIRNVAPRARLVRPELPPVAGAALLALDRLAPSGRVDEEAARRLAEGFAAVRT